MKGIPADNAALHLAFSEFASVSRDLESTYRGLERQVAELSQQLTRADRELEVRLREKQRLAQRFEHLLAALPGGVIVLDAEGRVQECNPAAERLLGQSLFGLAWRDVAQTAFTPQPDDGHDITLATGYRVNVSTCSLHDEPGQILLLADVTETRRLQAQAARLERLTSMGRTVAALAHQVRTPLATALLHASTLAPGAGREKILARLGDLERLVEDMLAYARHGEFSVEPVDLKALLESLAARQSACRAERLHVHVAPGLPAMVQGNPDALLSIVQNLLDNAWDADARAAVHVSLRAGAEHVVVECTDTGPGIPAELHSRVFDRFFTTRDGRHRARPFHRARGDRGARRRRRA